MTRIAIPVNDDGTFSEHFGRSKAFHLCEVEVSRRRVERPRTVQRKAGGCESLPTWLASLAVHTVLAGGIGAGARQGLAARSIAVSAGHEGPTVEQVLDSFFGQPAGGEANICGDHGHEHEHHHCRHD